MLRSGWRTCCALFPVGSAFEGDHLDHCCVCSPHVSASLRTDCSAGWRATLTIYH